MIKSLLSVSLLSLLLMSTSFAQDLNYKEKLSFVKERVDLYFFPQMGLKQKVAAVNNAYTFVKDNPNYIGKEDNSLIKRIEIVNTKFWTEKRATALYHNIVKIHYTGKYLDKLSENLYDLKVEQGAIEFALSTVKLDFPDSKLKRKGDVIGTRYIPNSTYLHYIGQFVIRMSFIPSNTKIIISEKSGLYEKPTYFYRGPISEEGQGLVKFSIGVDPFQWNEGELYSHELLETLTRFSHGFEINVSSFMLTPEMHIEAIENLRNTLTMGRWSRLHDAGIKQIEIMEHWDSRDDLVRFGTLTVGVKQEDIEFIIDTLFPPEF